MNTVPSTSLFGCITLLSLFSFACAAPLCARDRTSELRRYATVSAPPPCPQRGSGQDIVKYHDYVMRMIRTDRKGCIEVRKGGIVVYQESDARWYGIGNKIDDENLEGVPALPIGTDITGGGIPEAVVWSWSGGAHCCYTFHVLQLGKHFLEVAEISADHSEGAYFADLRHDGKYEFVGNDWAFAWWHASFARSPAPRVVLRPEGMRLLQSAPERVSDYYLYHLSFDLMKRPGPTPIEFDSLVRKVKGASDWKQGGVPPELWGAMLNLIYTGHAPLAWKLLDQSWPNEKPGKSGFIGAFCDRLGESRYWSDLAPVLKGSHSPPDCLW